MLPLLAASAVGKWAKETFVNKWTIGGAIILALISGAYFKGCQDERNKWLVKEATQQTKDLQDAERKHEALGKIMLEREREIASGVDLPERVSVLLSSWPDQQTAPARTP